MTSKSFNPSLKTVDAAVWSVLSEVLILSAGFVFFLFLTYKLGPAGYGLYALSATLILWIEWSIIAVFSRATIKLASESDDWMPIGATVLRLHLAISLLAVVLIWLTAGPLAEFLGEPVLAGYLRLFAVDIPVFSLAYAHKCLLDGTGLFRKRILTNVVRWTAKVLLVFVLVELGLSIEGAILANIGASAIELYVSRFWVRPGFFHQPRFPARRLFGYAAPLFVLALSLRLFDRMDLFALKALGGTTEQAGTYSVAQYLSFIPSVVAFSLSPLLLSTISRTLREGNGEKARQMTHTSLRMVFWMLPLVAVIPWVGPDVVDLILSPTFAASAEPLPLLMFGAWSMLMLSIITTILAAADKPYWTVALSAPLVPVSAAGYILAIPQLGATGAAFVKALVALGASSAAMIALYRLWGVAPRAGTLKRIALACLVASLLSALLPGPGFWLIPKLILVVLSVAGLFYLSGEFSADEVLFARAVFSRGNIPENQWRDYQ